MVRAPQKARNSSQAGRFVLNWKFGLMAVGAAAILGFYLSQGEEIDDDFFECILWYSIG